MARPGADANLLLNLAAQQVDERQPVQLGERIPNRTFEAVVFAAMRDRQLLARQIVELRADQPPRNVLDDAPVVVAVQLAQADDAVIEIQLEDALGQLIELHASRTPGRRPAACAAAGRCRDC